MSEYQTTAERLRIAVEGGPAALRRFQAQELRQQAAILIRNAETMEAEAAALEASAT